MLLPIAVQRGAGCEQGAELLVWRLKFRDGRRGDGVHYLRENNKAEKKGEWTSNEVVNIKKKKNSKINILKIIIIYEGQNKMLAN